MKPALAAGNRRRILLTRRVLARPTVRELDSLSSLLGDGYLIEVDRSRTHARVLRQWAGRAWFLEGN